MIGFVSHFDDSADDPAAATSATARCDDAAGAACLLCDGEALAPLHDEIADYEYGIARSARYHACRNCGFVMQLPRVPAAVIPDLYPDDYQTYAKPKASLFGAMKRFLVRRDARRLLRLAGSPAPRILEIGCGNGALLEQVLACNPLAKVCGIDIKDLGLSANPLIDFRLGQLEDVDLPPGSFDAIYCSNLIEHVADPLCFLARLQTLLRPGGCAVIITPNHLSLDRFVFGRRWGGYHFPRHLVLFDHHNVKRAMQLGGLSVEKISGSYAWWAISLGNCLFAQSGRHGRGLLFAGITLLFLPFDLVVNRFRPHGSMTVIARSG